MEGSNKASIKNHRERISSIRRNHVHDPDRIINQRRSKASKHSVHVHHIPHPVGPKVRQQLLVMANPLAPLGIIMSEGAGRAAGNVGDPLGCHV